MAKWQLEALSQFILAWVGTAMRLHQLISASIMVYFDEERPWRGHFSRAALSVCT